MAPHVGDELVERGPTVLRAADALVDVLDGAPAARRDVAPQLEQLVLGGLVVRADARVDGDLHALLRRLCFGYGCSPSAASSA